MANEQVYREMTVADGVTYIEQNYTANDLKNVTCFSDLHEICDANMTLPFHDDCNDETWMAFANAIIKAFDQKYHSVERSA